MIEQYVSAFNGILAETLYNTPSFIKEAIDDSISYTPGAKQFISGNIGTQTDVIKNPTTALNTRSDAEATYAADWYTLGAQVIQRYEDFFLQYSKMEETARYYAQKFNQSTSHDALVKWATTAKSNLVFSSSNTRRNSSNSSAQRKKVTYNDLVNVHKKFSESNFDTQDLICVLNYEMLGDLLEIDAFQNQYYTTQQADSNAPVGRILGFEVYAFGAVPTVTLNSGYSSIQSVGSSDTTPSSRSSSVALFASKQAIRRGLGGLRSHVETSATQLGQILSCELYAGASTVFENGKGVVLLVEGN